MSDFIIHPLLLYSQHDISPGHCSSILWDLREPPGAARPVLNLEEHLSLLELAQLATSPPLPILHITCDIFPEEWPITVTRDDGVAVGDVLEAIHQTLLRRISHDEWNRLSQKQQERIKLVFDNRCSLAENREECRSHGVLRVDCVVHHTWFAGLSTSPDHENTCILSLRRPRELPPSSPEQPVQL
jgi:hypothetical protein